MRTTQDVMQKMHAATRKAFGQVARTSGLPTDPALRLYKSLNQADFERIAAQFGEDKTMEYIRTMEARQMIGGQDAKSNG
jgi:hypothetical protein